HSCIFFFFFQAEDGIRDRNVTGVQTCALPISRPVATVVPPLQQVVQHLVLGEPTIVQEALRHVDRVRRAPPSIALALIGGTRIARARHLVPLHPVEVTLDPGAAFYLRPPYPVDGVWRERYGAEVKLRAAVGQSGNRPN